MNTVKLATKGFRRFLTDGLGLHLGASGPLTEMRRWGVIDVGFGEPSQGKRGGSCENLGSSY